MTFNQKLAVTSAGIALGFTAINANPSKAATITSNFTLTGTSGALLNQQFSGSYSYDDSTTPTIIAPLSTYPPKYRLTDFSLSILGENYSVANFNTGAGYGGSATGLLGDATILAPVEDLVPAGYGGSIGTGLGVKSSVFFVEDSFFFSNNEFGQRTSGGGTVSYTPVPEPSTNACLSVVGLSFMLLKKKATPKQRNNKILN